METAHTGNPVWYRIWRILLGITLALMLICVGIAIPATVAAPQLDPETPRLKLMEMLMQGAIQYPLYTYFVLMGGFVILVGGLFVGAIVTWLRPSVGRVSRRRVVRTIAGYLLVALLTGAVVSFGVLNISSWHIENQFASSCVPLIKMVTYVDENRNGIRDVGERGLRGVSGTTTVSQFSYSRGVTDSTYSFETGLEGERVVPVSEEVTTNRQLLLGQPPMFCETKHVSVTMGEMDGYAATSISQCTAFSGQYRSGSGTIVCYAGYAPNG